MLIEKIFIQRTPKSTSKTTTKNANLEKTSPKSIDKQNSLKHSDGSYGKAQVEINRKKVLNCTDSLSGYKDKTYGEKFSIPDNQKANGIKNRAQFILLKEALSDMNEAQEILNSTVKDFGGDLMSNTKYTMLDGALSAKKRYKKESEDFLVNDKLMRSKLEFEDNIKLVARSMENDFEVEYACSNYQLTPDAYFYLSKIRTPKYVIYCSDEYITAVAKDYKQNLDGSIKADKLYKFNGDNFELYEDCTYSVTSEGYPANKTIDSKGKYCFATDKASKVNAGKLTAFTNKNLCDENGTKISYEYDDENGWKSSPVEE